MCQKYTEEELNTMNHDAKNAVIYQMQERLDKLEHDYERLIEQIHLADQERFGRHTEKLNEIAGQLSFFNEDISKRNILNRRPSPIGYKKGLPHFCDSLLYQLF